MKIVLANEVENCVWANYFILGDIYCTESSINFLIKEQMLKSEINGKHTRNEKPVLLQCIATFEYLAVQA